MRAKPRDYQLACMDAIRAGFKRGLKGLCVELFTGGGKSRIIAMIAEMAREKKRRVLVMVNRDNLCEDLFESVAKQGLFPQMERGQDKASPMSEMVIGSIQTMQGERLKRWKQDHFGLVITDEVHFGAAESFRNTLNHFRSAWHVGLSATIERHDKRGLWDGYEECVFSMPLTKGIEQGWLVPFEFMELPVPIQIDDKVAKKKGFTEEDESNVFNKDNYLPRLYKAALEARGDLKSLFFWPNCDASKDANAYFSANGAQSRHIDGYISRREQNEILEWFESAPGSCVHCSEILSYGYDNPSIQCVGIMRLSKSLPMLKQRLGRGTRPLCAVDGVATAQERRELIAASQKPTVRILDLMLQLGNVKHSFATPTDLITESPDEREYLRKERKSGVPLSLEDFEGKLKTKRETDKDKQLAKLAEDAANEAQKWMEKKLKQPFISDIISQPNRGEPCTVKQKKYLWVLGFRQAGDLSKSKASRLISRYREHNEKLLKAVSIQGEF